MSEVEAQVALALESNGLTSPRKLHSDGKENEVEKLEKSLIGCALISFSASLRADLLTDSLPAPFQTRTSNSLTRRSRDS